ncbi:unnamed protein product [Closterium sp. NIES-54]
MRDLSGIRELGTLGVRQATKAVLGGVQAATLLSSAVTGAQDVSTGTNTPRPLAPRIPLTKLLGRRGLTRALLLLGSPLHSSASASSTFAAAASAFSTPPATATAASTSTAATEAPTSATNPTPTPSSASTATTTAPPTSSSSLAPLALADAAPLTRSRRSADRLAISPPTCGPLATLWPARHPCGPLAALTARLPPLQPARRSLAPRAPPLLPTSRPPAARSLPFGLLTSLAARSPTCGLLAALAACSPPACGPLAAPAAYSLPACSPLAAPCSPRAALLQPARHPLQPARRALRPARRSLQPARRPLRPARRPLQPACRPLAAHLLPSCSPLAALWQPTRRLFVACAARLLPAPAAAPTVRRHAGRPSRVPPCLALRAALLVARHPALPTMASLSVLTFDHVGPSLAPLATADSATRPQWLTRDVDARLAIRNHLSLAERAHFGQHRLTKAQYDAVVARYSSPATAALGPASAFSGKRRSSKGKGGMSGGGGSGGGSGGSSGGGGGSGGGGSGGSGGGSGGFGGGGGGSSGGGGSGSSGSGGSRVGPVPTGEFGDEAECPHWAKLLRSGVDIFALDYDAILVAMYALFVSAEGDCYLYVPPDPNIEAASLGASESALPGTAPTEALHALTLDSGASRCFFRVSTTLTPLPAPVPVRLVDPSGAQILPVPLLFSCVRRSCRLLSHQTLLWHHRLGHPSLPCLCGMHSHLLVSCLPLQTLHMDVWGPARINGQGRERYFLLVVDDYTRYTTVFPLRSKGEDLPILLLHSDRGGEFSSDLSRDFCRGEGILRSSRALVPLFTILSRTSSPPTLFPASSLAFPLTRLDGNSQDPSQDVMFEDSVPFYRLFPYRTAPLPPAPLFLAQGPPPVDPLPPQGPAPSCVSQVDPLPGAVPVEVAVDSGAARGVASGGAESRGAEPAHAEPGGAEPVGAEPRGAEPEGAEPEGADSEGVESGGAEPGGAELGGAEPAGTEPGGAESKGAESGGVEPRGTASSGGPAGASPRRSPRPEPLSPQQLRQWFARRRRLRSGAAGARGSADGGIGAGGARATSLEGARVPAGAGGTGGAGAASLGGARPQGTGAVGAGGVGGAGVRIVARMID